MLVALGGVLLFASLLHWRPANGYAPLAEAGVLGWASHRVLPVLVLSLGLLAHISRLTRCLVPPANP